MSQTEKKLPEESDVLPKLPGYPRPDEPKLEDLPSEWAQEDRDMEGRKPDLGEDEEDPSEL
jgi:hypothetical protein